MYNVFLLFFYKRIINVIEQNFKNKINEMTTRVIIMVKNIESILIKSESSDFKFYN